LSRPQSEELQGGMNAERTVYRADHRKGTSNVSLLAMLMGMIDEAQTANASNYNRFI